MQQTTDAPMPSGSAPLSHISRRLPGAGPFATSSDPGDWDNKPVIPRIPNPRKPKSAADPLPKREPGKTLRPRPPATVGRPKPAPQRTTAVTR